MQIAELVLKYVQALVWPTTAVVLTFLFRRQLRQILLRLTRVEAAGASMEFAAHAEELAHRAEAAAAAVVGASLSASRLSVTRGPVEGSEGADEASPDSSNPWPPLHVTNGESGRVHVDRQDVIDAFTPRVLGALSRARRNLVASPRRAVYTARIAVQDEVERVSGVATWDTSQSQKRQALLQAGVSEDVVDLYEQFMRMAGASQEVLTSASASDLIDTAQVILHEMTEHDTR